MKLPTFFLTLFFFGVTSSFCFGQDCKYPSYAVGFRYYKTTDTSREYITSNDTISRPLLIHLWYPSDDNSDANVMSFKQYIELIAIRDNYSKSEDAIKSEGYNFIDAYAGFAKSNYKIGLKCSTQDILDSPVRASLNIPITEGNFPLIIYAPSNGKTPSQNHLIYEHLASRGYYVISVASAGINSIQRKDPGQSILAQVRDMEFILEYLEKNIELNYLRIGLLGFSTGGLANTIFQMKHPEVEAVCSMDGSHEYSFYIYLSKLKEFNIDNTIVPYYLLVNKEAGSVYPYYNSIKSNFKLASRMPLLGHFGFVSFWTYFDQVKPDSVPAMSSVSYNYMSENISDFFDTTLKGIKNSSEKLRNNVSLKSDFILPVKLDFHHSTAMLNTYLHENIDSSISNYRNNKENNSVIYTEDEISNLGRMFLDYDIAASKKLFLLNQESYSDSWRVYYDLAFVYKLSGERELAIKSLALAETKDPENMDIKNLRQELLR
jgi:tetratricopeptide (TPR) repeat protein